jgi:hypothetical protein
MASLDNSEFQSNKNRAALDGPRPKPTSHEESNGPALVAYIFVVPKGAEVAFEALRNLISQGAFPNPIGFPMTEKPNMPAADSWLPHSDAAEYLGISESTLYRYAEQEKIECRKLCGRLQYRLLSLDNFKDQHVRPARRSHRGGAIIESALSSGK